MDAKPSKSARKREARAVDALAARLVELADDELAAVPLDDELRDLVRETRATRAHGAARRQRLYLAKRLRRVDTTPIATACERLAERPAAVRRRFHAAEDWRDRLLADRGNLAAFSTATGRPQPELDTLLSGVGPAMPERERRRIGRRVFRIVYAELGGI